MDGYGHGHVLSRRPEKVVFGRGITLVVWKGAEQNSFVAQPGAMLHLSHGSSGVGHGNDSQSDQTVRRRRAVLLHQPVVVTTDDGQIGVVVRNVTPEPGAAHLAGIQHFGVDTVQVLLLHTLLGRPGARRALIGLAERRPVFPALTAV